MRMLKLFFGLLSTMTRAFVLGVAGIVLLTGVVEAAVVKVVSSGGFAAAYRALAPEFEHTTGNILATSWGPSMGNTPDAVPLRIQRGEPIDVGAVVARGEAEIGFQQISELKLIAGIDLVGPLPPEVQKITTFSAGIVVGAREPGAAKALISFLASPAAAGAIRESGLDPMPSAAPLSPKS